MDLKELLGEELYNQVVEKAGDEKVAVVSDGSYIPKQKFDDLNTELKNYKQQVADRDQQLDDLKKNSNSNENLQATIDQLKDDNKKEKQRLEQQLQDQKFEYELDRALRDHNSKNPKAVKGLLDTESIELDDNGQLKGLDKQIESLKESDDYLFNIEPEQNPDDQQGNNNQGGNNNQSRTNYKPGQPNKTNSNVDPKNSRDAGRERALKRHGLLNNDNNQGED